MESARLGTARRSPADADAALRDATAIAERVRADEDAADAARERYRVEPLASIAASAAIARHLDTEEQLLIERPNVVVELPLADQREARHTRGGLCITNRRLLVVSQGGLQAITLGDIAEIGVIGDRTIQISTVAGGGIAAELSQPRLFRVQLQAARERAPRSADESPQGPSR